MRTTAPSLEMARELFARRSWNRAFDAFAAADRDAELGAADLECLATTAFLIGRNDVNLDALERAHYAHVRAGDVSRGVRCAFWLGFGLLLRGVSGGAGGWFARAERLIEGASECAERGYLLLPEVERLLSIGDCAQAAAVAARSAEIAERCGDADLLACAQHLHGRALLARGEIAGGLTLLDEMMLPVTAGRLSPVVTGLMYCSVISACQAVCAADRAHEWTRALSDWCDRQPEMLAFTGACLVHRAQILRLHGAWDAALKEAMRARERALDAEKRSAAAAAAYEVAEIHRLRGELAAAEDAYRDASGRGADPQPGLSLLRLAQGRPSVAAAAIQRAASVADSIAERVKILPAHVEIMLAAGDVGAARQSCAQLESIGAGPDLVIVSAHAAHARGAIELAEGHPCEALARLHRARDLWQALDAPYHAAKARVAIALACRALGDEDGTGLELEAARAAFARLSAMPDLARLDTIARAPRSCAQGVQPLTKRELEVLRLVATGETNKQIAADLSLSEKTIARHVSNIYAKLGVPSRAAATAYAYRYRLI